MSDVPHIRGKGGGDRRKQRGGIKKRKKGSAVGTKVDMEYKKRVLPLRSVKSKED